MTKRTIARKRTKKDKKDNVKTAKNFIDKNLYDINDDGRKKSYFSKHLTAAWSAQLGWCVLSFFFPCIMAFYQRREVLGGNFKDYSFCQGAYGKCWCPSLAKACPVPCLCIEVIFCIGCAINGNRKALSMKYALQDRKLETCIVITIAVLTFFNILAAIFTVIIGACLLSQHQEEFEFRKKNPEMIIEV